MIHPINSLNHRTNRALPREGNTCNIMLSAAGRRVSLLRLLQQSLRESGCSGGVLGMDITFNSPAMQLADEAVVAPPYRDPACLPTLLELCQRYSLKLIIPTIDPELMFYAEYRDTFGKLGCRINVSSVETITIASDKELTHQWLVVNAFPTVKQTSIEAVLRDPARYGFPLVIKPRSGSSSIGLTVARDLEQVRGRMGETDLVVQTLARGDEYTVDVFIDSAGAPRCAVPRRRLETRGGEVSKGVTVRHRRVIELAKSIASKLPGARGVINIQIFHDPITDELNVIEINPRFGGGYPLSHRAGAHMTRWAIEEALGIPCTAHDDWQDGLMMLRYDEAVFVAQESPAATALPRT